jgi:serine-type D-Ala-D-Ala endopeptidase (penicillin-binding protein 7)
MTRHLLRFAHVLAAALVLTAVNPAIAQNAQRSAEVVKKKPQAAKQQKAQPRQRTAQRTAQRKVPAAAVRHVASKPTVHVPPRLSYGQLAGLHQTQDDLDLKSSVALVIDQDTNEVLFSKNDSAVLPIASLTKLMTALVVSEAQLPMDHVITIAQDDVDTEKWSGSRLSVGTRLTRAEAMHLALMSSENRAAHALGRSFPGGMQAFVKRMNAKARELGMTASTFVEPTGLSSRNQSSASDLVRLVEASTGDPLLREYSTSTGAQVAVGTRTLQYNNTNRLVKHPEWEILLQKTGYISEAGQCLVMTTRIAGRKLIMVFLDSAGKLSRLGDAERVRKWVESQSTGRTSSITVVPGVSS